MKKYYFTSSKNCYTIQTAGQFVCPVTGEIFDGIGIVYLYSYDTLIGYIVDIDEFNTRLYLTRYYDYSPTTIQHLHKFLKSFDIVGFSVPTFRKQCERAGGSWCIAYRDGDILVQYDRTCYTMETIYNLLSE